MYSKSTTIAIVVLACFAAFAQEKAASTNSVPQQAKGLAAPINAAKAAVKAANERQAETATPKAPANGSADIAPAPKAAPKDSKPKSAAKPQTAAQPKPAPKAAPPPPEIPAPKAKATPLPPETPAPKAETVASPEAPATKAEATARPDAPAPSGAKEAVKDEAKPADNGAAALPGDNIDEIDLEDDSAEAAKKPTITGNLNDGMMSLVDIECDEATLADVLRQFRKTTGANIISDDSSNLQKRVSVSLKHVPWLKGMTAILSSRGFRIEEHDNIFRVVEDLQLVPVSTRTFALNHASAKELADLFNTTYGRKAPDGKLIKQIATSFSGANVVVVTADDKTLSDCETIIKAVDKAVAQIYIEARFIELSNEALHKLGMQWNQLESWGGSVRNLTAGVEYNNGRAANYGTKLSSLTDSTSTSDSTSSSSSSSATTSLAGDSTSSSASSSSSPSSSSTRSTSQSRTYSGVVPTAISQAPGAGRAADSMNWLNARGFSGQLSVDDFRLALSAFESLADAKVFSNPKVIVSNGREAKVDMTTKYPNVIIDSNYTGQNSQNLSISTKMDVIPGEDKFMFAKEAFFSWGIQLSVTPRISPDGLISVEIVPTISDCTGYLTVNSSQSSDTPYTRYPIIEVKRLTTEFTMKDGATAVIGGLSKTSEEDIDSGIPYLREIPWVGPKLFGWKSREKVQKEIVVFVTVGIADPANLPTDIGLPKNAVLGREYVTGAQLEPGDRTGDAANALKLDMTALNKRKPPRGTVKITPVSEEVEPMPPAPATPAIKVEPLPEQSQKTGTVTVEPVAPVQPLAPAAKEANKKSEPATQEK